MNILMMLGSVMFTTDGTAFDSITRQWSFSWPAQQTASGNLLYQFTGANEQTQTIHGTVYPGQIGMEETVDMLAALGRSGKPVPLVMGSGQVMGCWCIRTVNKTGSVYMNNGKARKIEFSVEIVYFGLTPDAEKNRQIYDTMGALPEMGLDILS